MKSKEQLELKNNNAEKAVKKPNTNWDFPFNLTMTKIRKNKSWIKERENGNYSWWKVPFSVVKRDIVKFEPKKYRRKQISEMKKRMLKDIPLRIDNNDDEFMISSLWLNLFEGHLILENGYDVYKAGEEIYNENGKDVLLGVCLKREKDFSFVFNQFASWNLWMK